MLLFVVAANTGRLLALFNKDYYVVLLEDSEILTILALKPGLDCKNDAIPAESGYIHENWSKKEKLCLEKLTLSRSCFQEWMLHL